MYSYVIVIQTLNQGRDMYHCYRGTSNALFLFLDMLEDSRFKPNQGFLNI